MENVDQDPSSSNAQVSTARFRIKTATGEVEVAGSEAFVERRWTDVQEALTRVGDKSGDGVLQIESAELNQDVSAKAQKKIPAKRRGGPSCASRISSLQDGGYFASQRKATEVVAKLIELATPYEGKHVAAALIHLTKTGKLRRLKDDGEWAYINP